MMEAVGSSAGPEHPAVPARDQPAADPFGTWRRLRESQGDRVSLISLYAMAAEPRGLRAHELPLAERRALGARAISVIFPGWETVSGSDPRAEAVRVVPYDPAWAGRFRAWRDRLADGLGAAALRVEHVGSTAVPGLAAKPIVDIQVSVPRLGQEDSYVPQVRAAGLQLRSRDHEHRYFRPPARRPREVHVHVCAGCGHWERVHLLFRDFLRASPPACDVYAAMKREAAVRWRDDPLAYTEAKSDLILDLLGQAERWAAARGWRS
jgi:GrpB-like predicted nucleotidyltransferase (UPF0157 family)